MALPLMLLLLAAAAAITGNGDTARNLWRGLRYLLAVELAFLLVMACVGAVYEALSRSRERRLYQPPGQLVDIGGYRLHLNCSGKGGPTVVLDYGLEGSYLDWHRVQPEVARFTRVCSYDRGGYGWSDPSPNPRLPSVMVEELHALLAKAGEKPPYIIVGHSFGGFDALMFAHKYREEVAGVVLVDGSHPDELLPFYWRTRLWIRMMQFTMPLGLPRWRRWCGVGPPEIGPIKQAIGCRSQIYRTAYAQWMEFPQSADEIRGLGPLGDLPLVVIARDPERTPADPSDEISPQREQHWNKLQRELVELSTNATYMVAKGSGHDVPNHRPDAVVYGVRRVVEKVSQDRQSSAQPG
ncbi:MAG: alpha/beta hydrolase [Acidobacteriia bacterium]|nr:alpha/beta hydrolase [Terriglobia bacterium]